MPVLFVRACALCDVMGLRERRLEGKPPYNNAAINFVGRAVSALAWVVRDFQPLAGCLVRQAQAQKKRRAACPQAAIHANPRCLSDVTKHAPKRYILGGLRASRPTKLKPPPE